MNHLRLYTKLAMVPLKRSWFLLGMTLISFAQVMLALWFCSSIQKEVDRARDYSVQAKFVTVQMKDINASTDAIRDLLKTEDVEMKELSTEAVLKKMEEEEPELIQTVRAIGQEGLNLAPKVLNIKGVISDESLEKLKLMTDVYKLDVSPVHHQRLKGFYDHLHFEMRIAIILIFFLVWVQLIVFQKIQGRDASEIMKNLSTWGVGSLQSKVPAFCSMLLMSSISLAVSIIEWFWFRKMIWKNNAFLGQLSIDHSLSFPLGMVFLTFMGLIVVSAVLAFSGKGLEE